jgi:hypothetical protein
MLTTKLFDERIRETLKKTSQNIEASERLKLNIYNQINQQPKEKQSMKKIFTMKRVAIIAAILCLTTITVFAASKLTSVTTHTFKTHTIEDFSKTKDLQNELGYSPKTIEIFSNGYKFQKAQVGDTHETRNYDDSESSVQFKSIFYSYALDNGHKINLNISKKPNADYVYSKTRVTNYNGINLNYTNQAYKFVPEDYKMTAEDIKAQESEDIVFSYGSDEVITNNIQTLIWVDNDITYILFGNDTNLSETDFINMAKEIINQ